MLASLRFVALVALTARPRYVAFMTDPGMDFDLLQRRIADVKRGISSCRLVVLESMVPGQKLIMTAPPELVELLHAHGRLQVERLQVVADVRVRVLVVVAGRHAVPLP